MILTHIETDGLYKYSPLMKVTDVRICRLHYFAKATHESPLSSGNWSAFMRHIFHQIYTSRDG